MAVSTCKNRNGNYIHDWDLVKEIESKIKPLMGLNENEIWGVGKDEPTDVLWDVYQVLHHRISWDYAKEQGYVKGDEDKRDWSKMTGVSYDEPMRFSTQPLPKINRLFLE